MAPRGHAVAAFARGRTPLEALGFIFSAIVFVGSCGYVCHGWYSDSYDIHLQHARVAIYEMMDQDRLAQAGFFDDYPDGTPSDFVAFVDPDGDGGDFWPPKRSEVQQMSRAPQATNIPDYALRPDNVRYVAFEPDLDDDTRQLVYIPHDDDRTIELHGYVDPDAEPLYTWTIDFPTTVDDE